jgi:hypothetical protein
MVNKLLNVSITILLLVGMGSPVFAGNPTPTPTVDPYMDFKGPCHDDPRVIGKCFSFEGRASNWNGNPTLRIWMIGTHRVLGIREGAPIPGNLTSALKDFDTEVYGTFTVCPFTPYKKGVMQIICVDSVKITKVVERK